MNRIWISLGLATSWLTSVAIADEAPIMATVESSMATDSNQIRQLAFDGDDQTFFASKPGLKASDHFTLIFDKPVVVKSVDVKTGRLDSTDVIGSGVLEGSSDGKTFEEIAPFREGSAKWEAAGKPFKAIRIKVTADLAHALAIRELVIKSDEPVATFAYPIEFVIDVADAPEMKAWAEDVARLCERWYPRINEELKSDGYKPARQVTMSLKSDYNGVAEAGGGRIKGSVKYFQSHPDDKGAMIHETVHIVQRYRGRGNPSWLVEGVADYLRFWIFEPGKAGRLDPNRARYNASYRTSAAFLAYLTDKYDKTIVLKLNKLMREGKYKEDAFKELTGKTLTELGDEWKTSLRKE